MREEGSLRVQAFCQLYSVSMAWAIAAAPELESTLIHMLHKGDPAGKLRLHSCHNKSCR